MFILYFFIQNALADKKIFKKKFHKLCLMGQIVIETYRTVKSRWSLPLLCHVVSRVSNASGDYLRATNATELHAIPRYRTQFRPTFLRLCCNFLIIFNLKLISRDKCNWLTQFHLAKKSIYTLVWAFNKLNLTNISVSNAKKIE